MYYHFHSTVTVVAMEVFEEVLIKYCINSFPKLTNSLDLIEN